MKINKKLAALMMTFVIGGVVLTGCGQQPENKPSTEQGTPNESENTGDQNQAEGNVEGTVTDGDESYAETDPTVAKETIFVITDGLEMPASSEMPEEMFADSYGINKDLLTSFCVQMPLMNVHATEIAVFEVKDKKDIDAVKAGIEKRQKALEEQWKSYLPEQYELVKNSKTVVKGNLVLYVISPDADQIVEKFEAQ